MDYHDIKRQYSGWRAVDYRNQLVDVFMQIKRGDDSATMKLVIIGEQFNVFMGITTVDESARMKLIAHY